MALLYQLKRLVAVLISSVTIFSLSGCGINNIPTYNEAVDAAWSQVLNQYKKRADLIPSLVNTVKGFTKNEKEILSEVVKARNKATRKKIPDNILSNPKAFKRFQARQDDISSALSKLMVMIESYPELKSDQNILALSLQLEGTENRIAVARRDYIEAVRKYNTELDTIPGRWWKSLFYSDAVSKENYIGSKTVQGDT